MRAAARTRHRAGSSRVNNRRGASRYAGATFLATITLSAISIAAVVRSSPPADSVGTLRTGLYHGWVGHGGSRFHLLGSGCPEGDEALLAHLSTVAGGSLRVESGQLPGSEVRGREVDLDLGRHFPVVELTTVALESLTAGSVAGPGRATSSLDPYGFSRVALRCRSWREVHADIGRAAVVPLPGESPPSEAILELHALPVPDVAPLIAILMLWNRGEQGVVIESHSYGPEPAVTGGVLVVAGRFERYDEMEGALVYSETPPSDDEADDPAHAVRHLASGRLELALPPGAVALVGLDRRSFVSGQPRGVLLSYPVVGFRHAGATYFLGADEPLFHLD